MEISAATLLTIAVWSSVAFGTLEALFVLDRGCLAKLFNSHPLNKAWAYGFKYVIGPFWGLDGVDLRVIIGTTHGVVSIGKIVALWGTATGTMHGDVADIADTLLICAYVVGVTVLCGAVYTDLQTRADSACYVSIPLALLNFILLTVRAFATPLSEMLTVHVIVVATVYLLCLMGFVIMFVLKATWGMNFQDIDPKRLLRYNQLMKGIDEEPQEEPRSVELQRREYDELDLPKEPLVEAKESRICGDNCKMM